MLSKNDLKIQHVCGHQIFDSRGNPTVLARVVLAGGVTACASVPSGASIADVAAAATQFVGMLDATQKSAGLFEYSNTAQKAKWSNFPNSIFPRSGIQFGTLSDAQQAAWLSMVQKSLSTEAYNRFLTEWKADDALASTDNGGGGPGGGRGPNGGAGGAVPPHDAGSSTMADGGSSVAARNPRTGSPVEVSARPVPVFKPSKELKAHIASGTPEAKVICG